MDIFLIDWERPKFQEQRFQAQDEEKNRSKYDVNAWRSLFLINELNELQTYKLITQEFTLILFALIMEGFGLKYWTQHSPSF